MELQTNNQPEEIAVVEEKQPSTALKVLVLIFLIALLIVGILLPIKLVPTAISTLNDKIGTLFSPANSTSITFTTDTKNIVSGSPFKLTWSGTHQTDGVYAISYTCTSGINLSTSINRPNEHIACNAPYFFSPKDNSIELTAITTTQSVQAEITLSFLKTGSAITALGKTTLTIGNPNPGTTATSTVSTVSTSSTSLGIGSSSQTTVSTPVHVTTPHTTTHPTHNVSNPNGTPDLSVTILSVGYLNPATSQFIPSTYVPAGARVALRFVVKNTGTKDTGSWGFSATLPSTTHPTYTAYNQNNIHPGNGIIYTLGFDGLTTGNSMVTITAALNGGATDANPANNIASIRIN